MATNAIQLQMNYNNSNNNDWKTGKQSDAHSPNKEKFDRIGDHRY